MFCKAKPAKKNFFYAAIWDHFPTKFFWILRPLLSSNFPQGFRSSKNFGHPTSGSGGKIGLKIYFMKGDKQTHIQTRKHTDTRTIWLLDRIGPVGRFDEKVTLSPCQPDFWLLNLKALYYSVWGWLSVSTDLCLVGWSWGQGLCQHHPYLAPAAGYYPKIKSNSSVSLFVRLLVALFISNAVSYIVFQIQNGSEVLN